LADYSLLDEGDLRELAAEFGVTFMRAARVKGGMANSSYLLDGTYILSVLNNHDLVSANELAGIVAHVNAHGVTTPGLIARRDGGTVARFGDVPVILRPYVAGVPLSERSDLRGGDVGALLAGIHMVPPLDGFRSRLRRIPAAWRDDLAGQSCPDLVATVEAAEAFEATGVFEHETFVFTHGDFFPDNIIEQPDGELVPIDWEAAAMDSALFDLGIALVTAATREEGFHSGRARLMVDGYARVRGVAWDEALVLGAARYAAAMLGLARFVRHNVRLPNAAVKDSYREMLALAK
jgi:homoserine kinase type II